MLNLSFIKENKMGAAYDAICENEHLEETLKKKNRTIREQKKLITELAIAYKEIFEDNEQFNPKKIKEYPLYSKVIKLLAPKEKKK